MSSTLCPECGHMLSDAVVAEVERAPQPCPGCDATLTADRLAAASANAGPDVLEGWDIGADASEIAAWRRDERPFPTDTVVVLAAGCIGGVIGGAAWTRHRASGTALGIVAGLLAAAIGRRIWELED